MHNIKIIGGGSWGAALACALSRKQKTVELILRCKKMQQEINLNHTNSKYLGDILLPSNIVACIEYNPENTTDLLIAVPSDSIMSVIQNLRQNNLPQHIGLIIATKGICSEPIGLLSSEIKKILPNKLAFLSGPNFADEIAKNLYSETNIASENMRYAESLSKYFSSENFIALPINDIVSMQIAGVIKNIVAIEVGYQKAKGVGANAVAAIVSQGLADIMALSIKLGGLESSASDLCVVGDLALTCYGEKSVTTALDIILQCAQ